MKPDKKEQFIRVIRRNEEALLLLLMIAVTFLVYANTLHNPFVFDDLVAITKNRNIRLTSFNLWELMGATRHNTYSTRPLALMSFALNYSFHQNDPFGYHVINILIHLLSGIFLYFFLKTTCKAVALQTAESNTGPPNGFFSVAYAATFLWLVNPVQTQSVNYVIQRMNSMAAMFFVLSLLLYAKSRLAENRNRKRQLFAACLLTAILSVSSKENAAVLPAFIFLYEWYFFKDLSIPWFRRRVFLLTFILLFIGVLGFLFLKGQPIEKIAAKYATKNFTMGQRVLTEARVVIYYLSLMVYPHPSRLNLDYDIPLSYSIVNPVSTLFSIIFIGAMLWLAVRIARRERFFSFCILWYFGNLVIESSIIPVDIIYEHRMYLPSMLAISALVFLFYQKTGRKRMAVFLFVALGAVWSFWTVERNKIWQDEAVLWADAAEKSPAKARPHINLSDLLISRGKFPEAVRHSAVALKIDPNSVAAHINMGSALFGLGKMDAAMRHFQRVLELAPADHQAHNNIGLILVCKGDLKTAIIHFQTAVEIKPAYIEARKNLNKALELSNAIDGAIHDFENSLQALDIHAEYLSEKMNELHFKKIRLEKSLQRYQTAISRLRKDKRFDPNEIEDVGRVKKKYEDRMDLFQQMVQQRNIFSAQYDIACILSRKNRGDEAVHSLFSALKNGFNNRDLMKADTDLHNIKRMEAFKGKWPDRIFESSNGNDLRPKGSSFE